MELMRVIDEDGVERRRKRRLLRRRYHCPGPNFLQLQLHAADWWINFFKDLRDSGLYNDSDPLHVECLRYCFMQIVQEELDRVAIEWNQHTLQVKRNSQAPRGKPDVMFFTPALYDTND